MKAEIFKLICKVYEKATLINQEVFSEWIAWKNIKSVEQMDELLAGLIQKHGEDKKVISAIPGVELDTTKKRKDITEDIICHVGAMVTDMLTEEFSVDLSTIENRVKIHELKQYLNDCINEILNDEEN